MFHTSPINTYESSVAGAALDLFQARFVVIPSVVEQMCIYRSRWVKMSQVCTCMQFKCMLSSTNLLQTMALSLQKCKLPKLQQKGQKLR